MKKVLSVLFILVLAAAAYGATVTVTKPANGETWVKGQTYAITWTKTGDMPNNVKISLRDKTSTVVVQEIVDPAPNSGTLQWLVPASVPDGQYCIRVKVKNVSISDDSDVFNIAAAAPPPAASVTVTKPASTDKWNRNKTYAITWTKKGLLVPTPWGDFEATIVSTPVDRMVRVPLSPNTGATPQWVQPYVTAGARKSVDGDPVLEQARAVAFGGDVGRAGNLKAGAGVVFRLDGNVELFGEYQFMRFYRETDGRGSLGPLGTTLDATGFSLGLSVRY